MSRDRWVVLLTYQFPPTGGAGSLRMLAFAKHLREFGWKARIGFEEGLRETVEWFEQHREEIP
jgi:nucleoside-diphosphate-sugar epimerase